MEARLGARLVHIWDTSAGSTMLDAVRILNRVAAGVALAAAGFTLSACLSTSSLDQLNSASPSGSPFQQGLFKNYEYLARSFGSTPPPSSGMLDFGVFGSNDDTSDLAEAFATKALIAAKGVDVEPEPANSEGAGALRSRLVQALANGKDRFPVDAARAQADFDCWMLNGSVAAQQGAAQQCRGSFNSTLMRFEQDMRR